MWRYYRSSRSQMLFKIDLKNFTNFTEKYLCCTLFPVKFVKIFKNNFFSQNISGGCFWYYFEIINDYQYSGTFFFMELPYHMLLRKKNMYNNISQGYVNLTNIIQNSYNLLIIFWRLTAGSRQRLTLP